MMIEKENIHQYLYVHLTLDNGNSFSENTQYPGSEMIEVSSDVASISLSNVQ